MAAHVDHHAPIALSTVIGFAAGIVALLSRLIGPEDH
jgi:hypothetical protein